MEDSKVSAPLEAEARILFRAHAGQDCPPDAAKMYADALAGEDALTLPGATHRAPWLLNWCAPLPGRDLEFDRRRRIVLALAECHPESAPIFYQQKAQSRLAAVVELVVAIGLECLRTPVRRAAEMVLWPRRN